MGRPAAVPGSSLRSLLAGLGSICFAMLLALPVRAASGWSLDLAAYQQQDGAVTIERGGDEVDPYFALKAIFIARDNGADDAGTLDRFVNWLLPRLRSDGRPGRYSRRGDAWVRSRDADADDVALALWIEALLTCADGRSLRPREARALGLARDYLELRLLDRAAGLYRPLADDNDPLLMDNVEVLAALRSVEMLQRRRRDLAAADYWQKRTTQLATAIETSFYGIDTLTPAVTAGWRAVAEAAAAGDTPAALPAPQFYPDFVAAPFAWLHGVPRARKVARFNAWLSRYGEAWEHNAASDYPWGLIALAARQEGRSDVAERWREAQVEQRRSGLWNVLEESAWQALGTPAGGSA
jgi:hypothetical protein